MEFPVLTVERGHAKIRACYDKKKTQVYDMPEKADTAQIRLSFCSRSFSHKLTLMRSRIDQNIIADKTMTTKTTMDRVTGTGCRIH